MATAATDRTAAPEPAPHVLVVLYPAQGHTIPLLDLATLLASRGGVCLTVVATPATAPLLAAHGDAVGELVLPFPSHPAFPAGVESAKGLSPALFGALIVAYAGLRAPLGDWARERSGGPDRVAAILSDFFCGWTQPLAAELGVSRIAFSPSAVYGTAVLHSLFRRMPQREDGDDESPIGFPDLPGAPAYPWRQLTLLYRTYRDGDEVSEGMRCNFLWNLEASSFVSNTFRRLEERYLAAPLADLGFRRVRAIRPLASDAADAASGRGGETAVSAADLCAWLDGFADDDGSVVYISFGSMAVLQPPHAAALAAALERTGAQEEGKGKGGPGVGAAGGGTAASAAGVPMLAWPMTADQFVNARLLVEEAGAAVPVSWGGIQAAPEAEEVARVLEAAAGGQCAHVAARAKELAEEAAATVSDGGASRQELDELVRELRELGSEPKE
ncbi:unnamed protein product [Urochloa decumbens]|uniref:Uncharacterized protein n=1 Tax=Urochloa decumbens TaxID=240449 RepID=A0ABC8WY46_9POAL